MLNFGRGARSVSIRVLRALELVIGQEALQAIVAAVLLLLQYAQVMVDRPMDLVKFGCAHLRVSPPEQQFVLFVLKLG